MENGDYMPVDPRLDQFLGYGYEVSSAAHIIYTGRSSRAGACVVERGCWLTKRYDSPITSIRRPTAGTRAWTWTWTW